VTSRWTQAPVGDKARPASLSGAPVPVAASDWRHRAACAGYDPELFFPVGESGPAEVQADQAKAVCRRCPVVEQCLAWAFGTGQDAGVWGGMTEQERQRMKRRSRERAERRRQKQEAAALDAALV